ncbi:MAG: glutamate synthase subunit alpha, partial [Treponema sp.]|nr:glutamate synthase subunit alpha [Treponema sp.]
IAQELREYMAKLGVHSIDEMVGRTDLLKLKDKQGFKRAGLLDMSRVIGDTDEEWKSNRDTFDFGLSKTVDEKTFLPAFEKLTSGMKGIPAEKLSVTSEGLKIESTDRTAGTILGSEIQKKFGNSLEEDTFTVNAYGGAGQSFGAFIPKGLTMRLEGEANDYFGKGLSGGKLVVTKAKDFAGSADENIIIGNVALFGSTSGKAFINGVAGERFCVRNSGATAVVEGCGDHGLEYMTGGTAVILGKTGRNLAAGMSGGIAYILDTDHQVYKKLNSELVKMYDLVDETTTLKGISDEENLKSLIQQHFDETGSVKAKEILEKWDTYKSQFKKILPKDYLRMKTEIYAGEAEGLKNEDAVMQAFKKITA